MWMEGFFSLGSHRGPLQGEDLSAESWKTKPSRRIGKGSCKAQSKAGATPPPEAGPSGALGTPWNAA